MEKAVTSKPSNPKDSIGIKKAPMSTVPTGVLLEVGVAMLEGALKYGRHNYRSIGVRSSVYYDAAIRHLAAWWEGEDTDPDSGLSHITKCIAGLTVLRDAMIQQKLNDDRPPRSPSGFIQELNNKTEALLAKYPDPVPAYTEQMRQYEEYEAWEHREWELMQEREKANEGSSSLRDVGGST